VSHLSERTYALLVAGTLPEEEARAVARHLDGACAVCEEFLASRGAADGLDGVADAAIGAAAGARGRGNDLEFARIDRRLRQGPRPVVAPPRWRGLPAVAAAAVLVVGLAGAFRVAGLRGPRPEWDGVKGSAPRAAPARLRFVVVSPPAAEGGAPGVERGVPGQRVARGASLQFEVEATRSVQAALVRVPADGAPELVWSERVASGRTAVTLEGHPAAYPLADLDGLQRFVLVASEERLAPDRLARAAAAFAPPARGAQGLPALDGLVLDAVDVEVR
jgi:hypothetical protein